MVLSIIKNTLALLFCTTTSLASYAAFNDNPPDKGAFFDGKYRNLAAEFGKTNGEKKLTQGFNNMFGYNNTQQLYYAYNENEQYKAHYIRAINPVIGDDIHSEGQSWGMTIAVMMNKQEEFDNLWRFARSYQKNSWNHSDPNKQGVYAWQLKFDSNGYVYKHDDGPAPDGELYFAFALLNADARWGSKGEFNYYDDAIEILGVIRNKLMENSIIRFSPYLDNLTDPSYHIPVFYNYFATRVSSSSERNFWNSAATKSRTFLKNHFTKISGNPHWNLPTFLAKNDGEPIIDYLFNGQANAGHWYEYDAWRVAMNVAVDAHLYGAENWHKNAINSLLGFLDYDKNNNGDKCYKQLYAYGSAETQQCAGTGQKATNAVATLASTDSAMAETFFNDFWSESQPTGDWRYYNGCLYMLAMLHVTGNFKLY